MDSVALMPCNPNIGGKFQRTSGKKIDALGSEMGKNIDNELIYSLRC